MPVTVGKWQDSQPLTNLTHLDGRNADKLFSLRPYFSELAWMKERSYVIASHLIAVSRVVKNPMNQFDQRNLLKTVANFSLADGLSVRKLEKTVNHDLKALELYLASKLPVHLSSHKRFILFGLGSEDINSIAFARSLVASRKNVMIPAILEVVNQIAGFAEKEKDTVMIARTHGLPAGITTFGKELANTLLRLSDEIHITTSISFQAKFTGEVGTLHALSRSERKTDWLGFGDRFISSLGLEPSHGSTQIVPYDSAIRYLQSVARINTILIDLCKNMWLYVLLGYTRVQKKEKEVGSSGMPHKVNPIYFEGAEGGLVMANGIIETMARTLMVNKLQRDFTDSTIRRNVSLICAYSLLSYQSIAEGFLRLVVDKKAIAGDLSQHAEVWIEPIKLIMLESGRGDAYELLKNMTRGAVYTCDELKSVMSTLNLPENVKKRITHIIDGQSENPYPRRIVREALTRVKKLHSL